MVSKKKKVIERVIDYYRDEAYFSQLYHLAAPIVLQNLLTSSMSMVGSVMVGQMGDAPMAAVGLASQVFFLLNLLLFGIGSGCLEHRYFSWLQRYFRPLSYESFQKTLKSSRWEAIT